MSHPLNPAIEMAMQAAERSGDFKDLPGAGKPLEFLSKPGASANPSNAVIDRILKENNALPVAVVLNKKITKLRHELTAVTDPTERKALMQQIADCQLKFDIEVEAMNKHG